MGAAVALLERQREEIAREGGDIIREIARSEPAKVIALQTGLTPRHVYNLREDVGQPKLAWPSFIMLAKQYPELRAKVLEWLDAEQGENECDPMRVLHELQTLLQSRLAPT